MIYTITTRTRKRGIYFEPHELRPLGIGDGSCCWGVWVEGRAWEERSRLDLYKDRPWTDLQSPHMMVSPLHPIAWPRAFTIHVLLERRRYDEIQGATTCDSFYGVTDALSRFGVNVLFAQTAQVGYDLISFIATCELPRLRTVADGFVSCSDQAGEELATTRLRLDREIQKYEDRRPLIREAEDKANEARAKEFQALGRVMIPRLAELEARLLLLEHLRYRWAEYPEARPRIMTAGRNDRFFELVVGQPKGSIGKSVSPEKAFTDAVSIPWFCNSKVIEAGENPYYLSYESITDRSRRRTGRMTPDEGKLPIQGRGELDADSLALLYDHTLEVLKKRPLNPPLDSIVLPSPDHGSPAGMESRKSGTAERLQRTATGQDYEDEAVRGFFRRQALMPVRIAALPSLAYARFWAFGGARGKYAPFRLRYTQNTLSPMDEGGTSVGNMARMYDFLSAVTRADTASEKGEFGPQSAVLATVNLRDQFFRLRFARERVEESNYLTVRITYKADAAGNAGVNSQGLLREVTQLLLRDGFRVERAEYRIIDSTHGPEGTSQSEERGKVDITGKAVTKEAYPACRSLTEVAGAEAISMLKDKWWTTLQETLRNRSEADASIPAFTIESLSIEPGFAPWDR